jgi:hypothetical protein
VTDPEFYANPQTTGTAEHAEWATIAAAPHWHGRGVPKRKGTLAQLAEQREQPAVDDSELGQHARQLEQLAAAGVVFGPDVSQYQGRPDWAAVKASGHKFALYKVSRGARSSTRRARTTGRRSPRRGSSRAATTTCISRPSTRTSPRCGGRRPTGSRGTSGRLMGMSSTSRTQRQPGAHLGVKEWVASTGSCSRTTR